MTANNKFWLVWLRNGKPRKRYPGVSTPDGLTAAASIETIKYQFKTLPGKPATKMLMEQLIVCVASYYEPRTDRVTIEKRD